MKVRGFNPTREQSYYEMTNGFDQHLEPRACVRNDNMVFPPHMRSVEKIKNREASFDPFALLTLVLTCSSGFLVAASDFFSGCQNQKIG
jgi:hypothetical protein